MKIMNEDNEKLFDALDCIGYVNRKMDFIMLPEEESDEKPFLLMKLKEEIDRALKTYCADKVNAEKVEFYELNKWQLTMDIEVGTHGMLAFG